MFCGGKNHVYLSANLMDETCFGEYQENINSPTVPHLRFSGGETMLRSCFSGVLANCMQFEEDKFPLHPDHTLVHKQGL